ncbi:MAG: M14 family zinc carboxypeptidase [Cytophagales bacterium]|nr:M14 family zinc carboxypeptidase [Cytophagales bacterium]
MHASEKAHAQMTPELLYRIAAEESDEMKKIRDNVITLVVPVINPDGLDIEGAWYRKNLGTMYETSGPPILYQEYVGHDNNRDGLWAICPRHKR